MTRWLLPALILAGGCADGASDRAVAAGDVAESGAEPGPLRVDLYPSSAVSFAGPGGLPVTLLPQSWTIEDGQVEGLDFQFSTPVEVSGRLTGFIANPTTADARVPGTRSPVEGVVQAWLPGTVSSRSVDTTVVVDGEGGEFAFQVTPATGYTVAWVPRDPPDLPLLVETDLDLSRATDLSRDLGWGVPVHGQVTSGEAGAPVAGARVSLVHPGTGVEGTPITTDATGRFDLRAEPGSWLVRVEGGQDLLLPARTLTVLAEDGVGAEIDVAYGDLEVLYLSGEVRDPGGSPLRDVLVRFTAIDLPAAPDGTWLTETTTGTNGRYSVAVLAGTYLIEAIPDPASSLGPTAIPDPLLASTSTELPRITLPERPVVQAVVRDASGRPLGDVLVRAEELGFDHAVYETVTERDTGVFSLAVSEGSLSWSFQPPEGAEAAITWIEASALELDNQEIVLASGRPMEGCASYRGQPVSLTLFDIRDADDRTLATGFTDADGCFAVRVDWGTAPPDTSADPTTGAASGTTGTTGATTGTTGGTTGTTTGTTGATTGTTGGTTGTTGATTGTTTGTTGATTGTTGGTTGTTGTAGGTTAP